MDRLNKALLADSTAIVGGAFGFIAYAGLKLFTGRGKEVPVIVWIIAAIFLFRYVYLGAE